MISAQAFCRLIQSARDQRWGYIWGARGQIWTWEKQQAAARDSTRRYGEQWVGRPVADCSGLGVWAFEQLGEKIYHGSNTIQREYVRNACPLENGKRVDGRPLRPGAAVFLVRREKGVAVRHHIGYYVGNGVVIEARGTRWGVVESPVTRWHETAEFQQMVYEGESDLQTVKQGDRGDDVRALQRALTSQGFALKADGVFGEKTAAALRSYQAQRGIQANGVCGADTWAALQGKTGQKDVCTVPRDRLAQVEETLQSGLKAIREMMQQ